MTDYVLRLTVAAPEADHFAANQMALVLGESAADVNSFPPAYWQDGAGNLYCVMSTAAETSFADAAGRELVAPPFAPDADLTAANAAQAKLVVWAGEGEPPVATPSQITAYFHDDPHTALAMMGLAPIEEEL